MLHIEVQYRDKVVEDMWTSNATGCCLYYGTLPTPDKVSTDGDWSVSIVTTTTHCLIKGATI